MSTQLRVMDKVQKRGYNIYGSYPEQKGYDPVSGKSEKKKYFENRKDYLMIIFGCIVTAISINVFLVPFKIAPGGFSGLATIIYYLIGQKIPVGALMLLLNIPLFIIGYRYIGKSFLMRTIFGTVLLSALTIIIKPVTDIFVEKYLEPSGALLSPDILLYSVFGGALMGIGIGLVFKSGATTGGTDLVAKIANHFIPSLTLGQVLLLVDIVIIALASVVFKSILLGLYAVVSIVVTTKIMDSIIEGINFAKSIYIISDKSDIIAEHILGELNRGVTSLNGVGMYTGADKKVLFCVLQKGQIPQLKKIVRSIDNKAFLILTDAREVLGEGFQKHEQ
jgi:uncharacterized membrane-anchored protein YitT (DUF2179 family)